MENSDGKVMGNKITFTAGKISYELFKHYLDELLKSPKIKVISGRDEDFLIISESLTITIK